MNLGHLVILFLNQNEQSTAMKKKNTLLYKSSYKS